MRSSGRSTLLTTTMGRKPKRQRLAGHKLGLRHRAFGCIDQQDNAINHRQDALNFATEIGMAGRIDDIDARFASFPFDLSAFRQNRDPAFFFEVVRIHRALFNALVVAESARLAEKLVNKGGFAMIDVRDDGDITQRHLKWAFWEVVMVATRHQILARP